MYIKKGKIDKQDHNLAKLINWVNDNYDEKIVDIIYLFMNYKKAFLTHKETFWNNKIPQFDIEVMNRVDNILKKLNLGSIKKLNLPDLFKELEIIREDK